MRIRRKGAVQVQWDAEAYRSAKYDAEVFGVQYDQYTGAEDESRGQGEVGGEEWVSVDRTPGGGSSGSVSSGSAGEESSGVGLEDRDMQSELLFEDLPPRAAAPPMMMIGVGEDVPTPLTSPTSSARGRKVPHGTVNPPIIIIPQSVGIAGAHPGLYSHSKPVTATGTAAGTRCPSRVSISHATVVPTPQPPTHTATPDKDPGSARRMRDSHFQFSLCNQLTYSDAQWMDILVFEPPAGADTAAAVTPGMPVGGLHPGSVDGEMHIFRAVPSVLLLPLSQSQSRGVHIPAAGCTSHASSADQTDLTWRDILSYQEHFLSPLVTDQGKAIIT